MAVLMAQVEVYVCQCHHFIKVNDGFNYLIIGKGRLLHRLMCHIWLLADFDMQLLTTRKLSRATSLCFWLYPRIRLFKWGWRRTMSLEKMVNKGLWFCCLNGNFVPFEYKYVRKYLLATKLSKISIRTFPSTTVVNSNRSLGPIWTDLSGPTIPEIYYHELTLKGS